MLRPSRRLHAPLYQAARACRTKRPPGRCPRTGPAGGKFNISKLSCSPSIEDGMAHVCEKGHRTVLRLVWISNIAKYLTIPQTGGTCIAATLTETNGNQFQKQGDSGLKSETSNEVLDATT